MFERIEISRIAFEFATTKKLHIEQSQFFESLARLENAKNDVFETLDASFESHDFQSTSQISSQFVFNVSSTNSTSNSITQTTTSTSSSSTQSIAFVSIETFEIKYSQRNRQTKNYALIQKFENSRREENINDSSNEHKIKRFSTRIRKMRYDIKYVISQI